MFQMLIYSWKVVELDKIVSKKKFLFDGIVGVKFNLLLKKWSITKDTSVNYISTFLRD